MTDNSQNDLYLMLGRIDSKLDGLAERLLAHFEDDKKLEERIAKVETRVTYWGGGLAIIIFVLTTFGPMIVDRFAQ
jgi:hypothetical protein